MSIRALRGRGSVSMAVLPAPGARRRLPRRPDGRQVSGIHVSRRCRRRCSAAAGAERIDLGWRFLQSGDTRNAARDFEAALKRNPRLYPAHAGEAYVALARGDHDRALTAFDAALRDARDYVPALVGKGQTLLAMKRDVDALAAFEAALAADGSLDRRSPARRGAAVPDGRAGHRGGAIGRGRRPPGSGARCLRARASQLSPDSAFLYRELAIVERRQGNADRAAGAFRARRRARSVRHGGADRDG